ncbi:MAG TPA: ATP-binding protein [Puia sp.]|jgi:two-component system NarL family sensor kinase|nr:ATP-binding protein [Puia sp.]
MFSDGKEIFGAVIAITFIVLLLSSLIVIVIINYKRKQEKYKKEKEVLLFAFENERIKIQTEVEEETRQNLASELHDNIGQLLSLTNVILSSVNMNNVDKAKEKIQSAQELVLLSIKDMRHLTKLVQGENILSDGLKEAIDQEIRWLQRNEYYKISTQFISSRENIKNSNKDLIIFRLFQESIHNIIKHADATVIDLKIEVGNSLFNMQIEDNGKGLPLEEIDKNKKGLGLQNMQKRTHMLGGDMKIESIPLKGTKVIFNIPYKEDV